MRFCELLPIGSVVLLKEAKKKLMIIGVMPIKHTETGKDIAFDYLGVPYPEGFITPDTAVVFMHKDIQEIIFTGYSNEERETFVNVIQKMADKADETVNNSRI